MRAVHRFSPVLALRHVGSATTDGDLYMRSLREIGMSDAARSSKNRLKFKVIRDHVAGCYARKNVRNGTWGTPWAYVEQEADYRDVLGRRRNALIVIDETSFLEGLPHG